MTPSETFGRTILRARKRSRESFVVGLLIPVSGPLAMLGPSALACGRLAGEAWNRAGGSLGREVRLAVLDAGAPSARLDDEVATLLDNDELDAIVALGTTPVGHRVSEIIGARVPMIFTTQFEGTGLPRWVHAIGETPDRQLLPAVQWMSEHRRVRRWYLLGNDYSWPRCAQRKVAERIRGLGGSVAAERYVALGERDFDRVVEEIAHSSADAVLVSLIGSDSVHMCRAFAAADLPGRVLRLSSSIEENALLGMGHRNTEGLFAVSGYFATIGSEANARFKERYHGRFGDRAPTLNSLAQSVYEGLVHLRRQCGETTDNDDSPLSSVRSVRRPGPRSAPAECVYLAEADGLALRVIQDLSGPSR